ncbi:MAG: tetratricopeptide repeat protein [Bacteroidia bacterium]
MAVVVAFGQPATGDGLAELRNRVEAAEGRAKMEALLEYSKALREVNRSEAVKQAELALQLSRKLGIDSRMEAEVLANYLETCIHFFSLNRAEEQLPHLKVLLPQLSDSSQLSLQRLAGHVLLLAGHYQQADGYLLPALEKAKAMNAAGKIASIQVLLADSYRYQGRYPEAMEARTASNQFFDSVSDSARMAEGRVGMGIIQLMTEQFAEAKAQFYPALAYFRAHQDSAGISMGETALSLAFFKQDSLDKALEHAWTSFKIREALGDIRGVGESLNNLALMYMKRGMWGLARDYLEASLENREQGQDYRQVPVMLANLGLCYRKLGSYDLSERLYQEAIERASASGADHARAQAYEGYQLLAEERGDYRTAYRYARWHDQLEDSLLSVEKERQLRQISENYEREKAALENEQLRLELKSRTRERFALAAIGLLIAIVALLVSNRQRMRIRQAGAVHEQEKEKLEERMKNYMQRVLEKNSLVEKLEGQLAAIEVKDNEAEARRTARLTELRQMKILTEEDWRTFRQHFESVYRGFLDRLTDQYPELTKGERRMFVLIKLNLSTSEIADILGISLDSVKKARYRLRKKLQLPDDQPLNDFIQAF